MINLVCMDKKFFEDDDLIIDRVYVLPLDKESIDTAIRVDGEEWYSENCFFVDVMTEKLKGFSLVTPISYIDNEGEVIEIRELTDLERLIINQRELLKNIGEVYENNGVVWVLKFKTPFSYTQKNSIFKDTILLQG